MVIFGKTSEIVKMGDRTNGPVATDRRVMVILLRTMRMVFLNFVGRIASNMAQMQRTNTTEKSSLRN
jgi:hypothetical protein